MFRILLVEDDIRIATLISEYLSGYEFIVYTINRGDAALPAFKKILPDIVILDLMLPGLDGMIICRQIREISNTLILILTARENVYDEVAGLEIGADDYVNKPIQPRVLLARLRALLRRDKNTKLTFSQEITLGPLLINKRNRQVFFHQQEMDLSGSEYRLLLALAENADEVLSRDDLLKKVRGIDFNGLDRSIDNNISRLRRKFNDDCAVKIKTIWGEGYLFCSSAWK